MLSTQQLLNFGDSNLDFFENNLLDQDDWRGITKFLYFQKVFFSLLFQNWQVGNLIGNFHSRKCCFFLLPTINYYYIFHCEIVKTIKLFFITVKIEPPLHILQYFTKCFL